jgi:hypothetical protein
MIVPVIATPAAAAAAPLTMEELGNVLFPPLTGWSI